MFKSHERFGDSENDNFWEQRLAFSFKKHVLFGFWRRGVFCLWGVENFFGLFLTWREHFCVAFYWTPWANFARMIFLEFYSFSFVCHAHWRAPISPCVSGPIALFSSKCANFGPCFVAYTVFYRVHVEKWELAYMATIGYFLCLFGKIFMAENQCLGHVKFFIYWHLLWPTAKQMRQKIFWIFKRGFVSIWGNYHGRERSSDVWIRSGVLPVNKPLMILPAATGAQTG